MRLKTYNAPTLHAALRLARIELGSEAVLLEAKEREAETAEARFQVTFALEPDDTPAEPPPTKPERPHWKSFLSEALAAAPEAKTDRTSPGPEPEAPKPRSRGSRNHKSSSKRPKKCASEPPQAHGAVAPPEALAALRTSALAAVFGRLVAAGVAASESASLATRAAEAAGSDDDPAALESALQAILDAGWKVHSAPEPGAKATRTIALAGPAGAGKSATAVRAAMLLLRAYDRPAALVSLGRHPVGGVEALDAWATLLGLRLEIVEQAELLPEALERLTAGPRPPGSILVDTPPDLSTAKLVADAKLETHLVLPAVYSAADQTRAIERFAGFAPSAVVYTRMDEAAAPGALWALQKTSALPASFLGCGPETPGGLLQATARRLTQRILGR
jgi:flagellar biosynthesis protein FlhF